MGSPCPAVYIKCSREGFCSLDFFLLQIHSVSFLGALVECSTCTYPDQTHLATSQVTITNSHHISVAMFPVKVAMNLKIEMSHYTKCIKCVQHFLRNRRKISVIKM